MPKISPRKYDSVMVQEKSTLFIYSYNFIFDYKGIVILFLVTGLML